VKAVKIPPSSLCVLVLTEQKSKFMFLGSKVLKEFFFFKLQRQLTADELIRISAINYHRLIFATVDCRGSIWVIYMCFSVKKNVSTTVL